MSTTRRVLLIGGPAGLPVPADLRPVVDHIDDDVAGILAGPPGGRKIWDYDRFIFWPTATALDLPLTFADWEKRRKAHPALPPVASKEWAPIPRDASELAAAIRDDHRFRLLAAPGCGPYSHRELLHCEAAWTLRGIFQAVIEGSVVVTCVTEDVAHNHVLVQEALVWISPGFRVEPQLPEVPEAYATAGDWAGGLPSSELSALWGMIAQPWPFSVRLGVWNVSAHETQYNTDTTVNELWCDGELLLSENDPLAKRVVSVLETHKDRAGGCKGLMLRLGRGAILVVPAPPTDRLVDLLQLMATPPAADTSASVAPPAQPSADEPGTTTTTDKEAVAPPSPQLKFTNKRAPQGSGQPGWVVKFGGKAFHLGHRVFLILLAHAIDRELGGPGINPALPKIGETDIARCFKKRGKSAVGKPAQQVNDKLREAGASRIIEVTPRGSSTTGPRRYRLALEPDHVDLSDLLKSTDEDVKFLLSLLPRGGHH